MAETTTKKRVELFKTRNVSGSDLPEINCNEFFKMTDKELFRLTSSIQWTIGELMFADNFGKITASMGFNEVKITTEYIGVWLLLHFSRPEKKRFLALFGKNFDSRNKIENFCKLHRWVKSKFPELPTMFRRMIFVNDKVFDVTHLIPKSEMERKKMADEFGLNINELKIQRTLCDLIIFLHTKGLKYHASRIVLWDFMRPNNTEPFCSPYLNGLCKYSKKGMLQFSNVGEYLKWFDQLYEMYVREKTAAGKSVTNKEAFILGFWDEQQIILHNKPVTSSLTLRHDGSIPEMKMALGPIDQLLALSEEARQLVFKAIGVKPPNITEYIPTFLTLKKNLEFLGVEFEEPKNFYKPFWNRLEIGGKDTNYFEKEHGVPTEEPLETVHELINWISSSHEYLTREYLCNKSYANKLAWKIKCSSKLFSNNKHTEKRCIHQMEQRNANL